MEPAVRKNLGVVGVVLMVAGVVTLVVAAYQAGVNVAVLTSWKPVQADFVQAEVQNQKILSSIHSARANHYLVTWTFHYDVAGAAHTASTTSGTHGEYSEMMAWARRFSPGQKVTIHYQADNPEVISAAAWDGITFAHATRTAAWGLGIVIVGFAIWKFSAERAIR